MAICRISPEKQVKRLAETTFEEQKVEEGKLRDFFARDDNIEAIEENLMVVGKEINVWRESKRYIDLLCIDKESNLVVLEFKRTKTGEYMEWQALRYAAMISACPFDQLVHQYANYLFKCDREEADGDTVEWDSEKYQSNARKSIEDFLGHIPDDGSFGSKVRIILVAAGFPAELTATVLWLNENYKLDIRCVEIPPSKRNGETFFEVRTLIPLPLPEEYQVGIKEKKEKASAAQYKKSNLRFNLNVGANTHEKLPCNTFMLYLISAVLNSDLGTSSNIEKIKSICVNAGRKYPVFWEAAGKLKMEDMREDIRKDSRDRRGREKRFYIEDGQLLYIENCTYAISSGWYCEHAMRVARQLKEILILRHWRFHTNSWRIKQHSARFCQRSHNSPNGTVSMRLSDMGKMLGPA